MRRFVIWALILSLLTISTSFTQDSEEPGYFGVQSAPQDEGVDGVEMADVVPNGPAWEAGLRKGDRVLKIDGKIVNDPFELAETARAIKPDTKIELEILREGKKQTIDMTVGRRKRERGYVGIRLKDAEEDKEGIELVEVTPRGPAHQAGLRKGDRVIEFDGTKINDPDTLIDCCQESEPGDRVNVTVLRNGEEKEVRVTVGRRPNNLPGQLPTFGFEPKTPLTLEGRSVNSEEIDAAAYRGLDYLLRQQQEDGRWEPNMKGHMLSGTADHAVNAIVMTSIVAMGVRSQAILDPDRAYPAIERARKFILDHLERIPVNTRVTYAVWHYAYGSHFLIRELPFVTDPEERASIKEHATNLLNTLLKMQLRKKEQERAPEEIGYLGVRPAEEDTSGLPGVLMEQVTQGQPAHRGGLRDGDRILSINEFETNKMDDVFEAMRRQDAGATVPVVVIRKGEERSFDVTLGKRQRPLDVEVQEEGGWNYYHMGQGVSFGTATVMLMLQEAKTAGFEVPQDTLDLASEMLEDLRVAVKDQPESYSYRGGIHGSRGKDVRGNIGRIIVCELALLNEGRRTVEDLHTAYKTFLEHRGELDKVKGFEGTHFQELWNNAAYYYYYGHYYAALGLKHLEPKLKAKVTSALREVMMVTQDEKKGTWVDHPAFSEYYGTAMALMTLRECEKNNRIRSY